MNLSVHTIVLTPEWVKAFDNAVACALATRTRALVQGVPSSELSSEDQIRSAVAGSLREAMLGFQRHSDARCLHLRCREEAIIVAVASKEAKLLRMPVEEIEMASLVRLHEFLDGRS